MLRTRTSRALIAGALALGVGGLLVLPAEHLHVAGSRGDHHAHRHFTSHHQAAGRVAFDNPGAEDVQWLDTAFDAPRTAPPVHPDGALAVGVSLVETRGRATRMHLTSLRPSTHDPPLISHGLRAPPALLPL